jgi:hypothetical protein
VLLVAATVAPVGPIAPALISPALVVAALVVAALVGPGLVGPGLVGPALVGPALVAVEVEPTVVGGDAADVDEEPPAGGVTGDAKAAGARARLRANKVSPAITARIGRGTSGVLAVGVGGPTPAARTTARHNSDGFEGRSRRSTVGTLHSTGGSLPRPPHDQEGPDRGAEAWTGPSALTGTSVSSA